MTLSKTMPRLLLELLRELESIGIDNEEIYDTVCREKMSDPIWKLFIRPVRRYKFFKSTLDRWRSHPKKP